MVVVAVAVVFMTSIKGEGRDWDEALWSTALYYKGYYTVKTNKCCVLCVTSLPNSSSFFRLLHQKHQNQMYTIILLGT